jgi:hypothetical protein
MRFFFVLLSRIFLNIGHFFLKSADVGVRKTNASAIIFSFFFLACPFVFSLSIAIQEPPSEVRASGMPPTCAISS